MYIYFLGISFTTTGQNIWLRPVEAGLLLASSYWVDAVASCCSGGILWSCLGLCKELRPPTGHDLAILYCVNNFTPTS